MFPLLSAHIFALAILLPTFTDMFNNNISSSLQFWKTCCVRKLERKILRSCPIFGVKAGLYGILTAQVGLQICEDIIDNTITLQLSFNFPQ